MTATPVPELLVSAPTPGVVEDLSVSALVAPAPAEEQARRWHEGWSSWGVPLRGLEHLAVLVGALGHMDYAGVTAPDSVRWAQTKRIGDRWVVEVREGSDGWPSVVVPATGDDGILARLSTDAGALWSHHAVAGVVWSWLDGSLPDGYALVDAPGQ